MIWKPTKEECDLIREAARREGQRRTIVLEVGRRFNVEREDLDSTINVALITDDPDNWDDTDLSETEPWSTFRKGVQLTEGGAAIVDFYIYEMTRDRWLLGNVSVYYEAGRITRLEGYGRTKDWLPVLSQ